MKKILNRKVLSVIALALVCVFAGTVIGATQPSANAEEKVVLTSPFTEAIAKVRNSVDTGTATATAAETATATISRTLPKK